MNVKLELARNALIRSALRNVSEQSYEDDYPERDASGGEAAVMREEELYRSAVEYVNAKLEDNKRRGVGIG